MASSLDDSEYSEDEIFFGPITLKEIKAVLLPKHVRQAKKKVNKKKNNYNGDNSVKIIEMHSEPEMNNESDIISSCRSIDNSYLRLAPDDSFIQLEKHVAEICMVENRNNDLEIVNFPLISSPVKKQNIVISNLHLEPTEKERAALEKHPKIHLEDNVLTHTDKNPAKEETNKVKLDSEEVEEIDTQKSLAPEAPSASIFKNKPNNFDTLKTPSSIGKIKAHLVKTPGSKIFYEHVASPVAEYIKNPPVIILRGDRTEKQKKLKNIMSNKENMEQEQETEYCRTNAGHQIVSSLPKNIMLHGANKKVLQATTKIPLKTHAQGNRALKQKILFPHNNFLDN